MTNFSAADLTKHPAASRWFFFAFQDDLRDGRAIGTLTSVVASPANGVTITEAAITVADETDPITGKVAVAGKTIRARIAGGVDAQDYTLAVTVVDDHATPAERETLVLTTTLRIRSR